MTSTAARCSSAWAWAFRPARCTSPAWPGACAALRARHPAALLLASFVGRAALLLGLGLWLVRQAHPLWTLTGYALAFLAVRTLAVRGARRGRPAGAAGQEGG